MNRKQIAVPTEIWCDLAKEKLKLESKGRSVTIGSLAAKYIKSGMASNKTKIAS